METRTYTVYKFDELPKETQEKAIEKLQDINTDYDWWDAVYEDAEECGKQFGVSIDKIYFSGFWSQGDGACFEGSYSFEKDGLEKIKSHAPKDEKLHRIAGELQKIQSANGNTVTATVKHSGHYYHSRCTDIDVFSTDEYATKEVQESVTELLRDLMNWIYSQLEKEYEYQTSDEAIKETIEANDYDFTDDGKIA